MASTGTTDWKRTACILCECNCGLEVQIEDGHLVKIRGDKAHPSSRGYACEKPHRLDHYQHNADRLTSPLRRRADGTFEEIDWDTAIREVAARLAKVRDEHGGDAIFYYGGGGQGNHLCGAYATATRRALGSRYRSSALAQEKTGEFWISDRMLGGATRADHEHADVALFLGKNPWHSHSMPRARVTLKELSADPARTLIVVDPRRTETAEIADIHLAVRPGTDAWLLVAILGILLEEGAGIDRAFLAEHAIAEDIEAVTAAIAKFSIPAAIARTGVPAELVYKAARAIAGAKAFASFEDLGVQMNKHSTLVSYLHKLLVLLTGSFGRPGTAFVPATMVDIANGEAKRTSPVTGAKIVGGLVPCNAIADEILTDHPKRFRAMLVESANPAHSIADSKRMREALATLDTVVVIDVAMSETAKLAHYVLPASSQFEKAEATFFNFDFPENYFHLRGRLFEPRPGTLPEAEIHARLCEALGVVTEADYAPLREAAKQGLVAYAQRFMMTVIPNPRLSGYAPVLLYRTLELPVELREGAVVFGLVARAAIEHGPSLARAGFGGSPIEAACALFDAIVKGESGVIYAVDEWPDTWRRVKTPDGKLHLALPDLLGELAKLHVIPVIADDLYPFVLAAGERRSFTANTIMRDPAWRKKDAGGALRMNPEDATALGVASGESVRLVTKRDAVIVAIEVTDSMQPGCVALPNGLGTRYEGAMPGVPTNELTASEDRDPFVGTPWHKYVPARVERVLVKRVALVLGLAACGFPKPKDVPDDGNGSGSGSGMHDAPLHDGPKLDGPVVDAPAACVSFNSMFFQACSLPAPRGPLLLGAGAQINTDADPPVSGVPIQPAITTVTQTDGTKALVLVVQDLEVAGSVQVTGMMPVIFAAYGRITVDAGATLDASSTKATSLGAGANPPSCASDALVGSPGGDASAGLGGSGGGGGAGFAIPGAPGGKGANQFPGGPSSNSRARPTTITGGCPGGPSGKAGSFYTTDPTAIAHGGGGGGALLLSTATSITITGQVLAGGAGGDGSFGNTSRVGAGGGGSGGLIVLEGPMISVGTGAVIAANGGGGGGAASAAAAGLNGAAGLAGTSAALGGAPSGCGGAGGRGGNGAAGTVGPMVGADGNSTCGGGGGGGAYGYILVYGPAAGISLNGAISPNPVIN